jgi:hypothetical protein
MLFLTAVLFPIVSRPQNTTVFIRMLASLAIIHYVHMNLISLGEIATTLKLVLKHTVGSKI